MSVWRRIIGLLPRRASRPRPPFFVMIPLRPRERTKNWDLVCSNLRRTLDNLLAQTDDDFLILLICHDVPPFVREPPYRGRVEAIDVGDRIALPAVGATADEDMWLKRRAAGVWLREHQFERGYVMPVDADDLVHRDVVRRTRKADNGRGYIFRSGYMVNEASGAVVTLQRFNHHCGTCAVFYFERTDLPVSDDDADCFLSRFRNHAYWELRASEAGRPLEPGSFLAACYMVNHGENDREYLGLLHRKLGRFKGKSRLNAAALKRHFPALRLATGGERNAGEVAADGQGR